MSWKAPEDLVLVAACETLAELEVLKGLLASADIESTSMSTSESGVMFGHKSVFSPLDEKPRPHKLLVRQEDAEEAKMMINTPVELDEDFDDDED